MIMTTMTMTMTTCLPRVRPTTVLEQEFAGMHVVEDPCDGTHVICELTGAKLYKCRKVVMRHLNGRQYKKALEELAAQDQSR